MKLCDFEVGLDHPFFLIAGTCVIESEQMAIDTAGTLKEITGALGIPFINTKDRFDEELRRGRLPYFAADSHLNTHGHEVLVELLTPWIRELMH